MNIRTSRNSLSLAVAALALPGLLVIELEWTDGPAIRVLRSAHAIVGAPMTPVSVAGVARRTTYRVVAAETATVAAAGASQQQAVAQQQAATAKQQQATAQQQAATAQQQRPSGNSRQRRNRLLPALRRSAPWFPRCLPAARRSRAERFSTIAVAMSITERRSRATTLCTWFSQRPRSSG